MLNAPWRSVGSRFAASMALFLAVGLTAETRAGFYAYAAEQTSAYSFTGATVGTLTPLSSTSAAQVGNPTGGESHSGTLDALQSYVGPNPRPGENTFTPLGQVNPDYVRGDALITSGPFTTNNVGEGFLIDPGNSAGSGSWAISAPITLTSTGTLTLGFNFSNLLTLVNAPTAAAPSGTVAADYSYNFAVQDSNGNTIFNSSPSAVNRSLSLVQPGSSSTPGSGTASITTNTLSAGTYTATISGSEHVFLNVVAVPEPASTTLMAIGVAALGGVAIRKRLSRARA
jgi:hypothetical protein